MDSFLDFLSRPYAGFVSVLIFLLVLAVLWFLIGRLYFTHRLRKMHLVILFLLNLTLSYWIIMEGYFRFIFNESDSFAALQTHKAWIRKHVRLNDFGLRDDKDYAPLRRRQDLVFLFGDSLQWGQGIDFEKTVPFNLQTSLPDYTFLNISGQGLSTSIELNNFENMLSNGFLPRIVVLNYYMNDIDSDGSIARAALMGRNLKLKYLRFSYSVQHIYARLTKYFLRGQNSYSQSLVDAYNGPLFNKHKRELLKFIHLARTSRVRFLVVIWPSLPVQEKANDNLNSLRRIIIDVLEDNQVEYIDIYPKILRLDQKSQIAGNFDAHPGAEVHKIASEAIAGWISNRGP